MGAHGFTGRRRYWNSSNLQNYLEKIGREGKAIDGFEELLDDQLVMERVLFGLRMNEGISWDMLPISKHTQIRSWIEDGFLLLEKGNLRTSDRGRLVLDELSARLI